MPDIGQGLFWVLGNVENVLLLSLAVFFCMLLVPAETEPARARWLRTLSACLLGFLLPAFHELAGVALFVILPTLTLGAMRYGRPQWRALAIAWIAVTIGFAIVYLAPANAVRAGLYSNSGNYRATLSLTLKTVYWYGVPWFLDIKLWLLTLLLWLGPGFPSVQPRSPQISSRLLICWVLGCWTAVVMFTIVAPIWFTGFPVQPRTLDYIYGTFLAGWLLLTFLIKPLIPTPFHSHQRSHICSLILIVLSVGLATSSNNAKAFGDIYRGRVNAWNLQQRERFRLLQSAGPDRQVNVNSLSTHPASYGPWDITEDSSHWSTRCLALYFGVASVRASGSHSDR